MLIVIIIIGILTATLIPRIWDARDRANETVEKINQNRSVACQLGLDDLCYNNPEDNTLPDWYTQLEYVRVMHWVDATYGCTIDLWLNSSDNISFETSFINTSTDSTTAMYLWEGWATTNYKFSIVHATRAPLNLWSASITTTDYWTSWTLFNVSFDKNTVVVNSDTFAWDKTPSSFAWNKLYFLWVIDQPQRYFKWYVYYLKVYDNWVLVRDMIPMKRMSDDVAGMYDRVEWKFYLPLTANWTFTAWPEV